jgi:hypothetical protein
VAKGGTRYGVMPALTLEAVGLCHHSSIGDTRRCDLAPTEMAVAPTTRECVGARGMAHLRVE